MKDKRTKLFSLSDTDGDYINDKQDKIEVVDCPRDGRNCMEHRSVINQSYLESNHHLDSKDYHRAIEALKGAFYKTTELKEPTCQNCVKLFQQTITQSLEEIQANLHKMTTGIFKAKRFQSSYELATSVLEEIKRIK